MRCGGHSRRAGHEGRSASAAQVDQAPGGGDERGDGHVLGLRHRGVAEHEGVDLERGGSANGHRASPVVSHEHQGPVDLGSTEGDELGDPVSEPPWPASLGVAHADLVDGDHAPVVTELGQQALPCVAPGRVAVHADDRPLGSGPSVEQVKVHRPAVRSVDDDSARPGRIEAP